MWTLCCIYLLAVRASNFRAGQTSASRAERRFECLALSLSGDMTSAVHGNLPLPSPFSYDPHEHNDATLANPFERFEPAAAVGDEEATGSPLFLGLDLSTQVGALCGSARLRADIVATLRPSKLHSQMKRS